MLAVRVRAAPVEGEANAALEKLLAKVLGAPPRSVKVVRGGQSRLKVVEVEGVDEASALSSPALTGVGGERP